MSPGKYILIILSGLHFVINVFLFHAQLGGVSNYGPGISLYYN